MSGDLCVSLNLSEEHVFASDVAGVVEAAATASEVPPERLQFEIPEAALVQADGRSLAKLSALSELGVSLTIDDCTGAAQRDLLAELHVKAIKIGRTIVAGIPDNSAHLKVATEAVRTGKELGLTVIANGVETPGQLASLRDMGCDRAQGFLFSIPMPADVLEERMLPR